MNEEIKSIVGLALSTLLVVSLLIGGIFFFDAMACHSQANALGLPCSWGPLQGCIVTRADGVKVNIDNYGRADRD